jgi:hypothetical protein
VAFLVRADNPHDVTQFEALIDGRGRATELPRTNDAELNPLDHVPLWEWD